MGVKFKSNFKAVQRDLDTYEKRRTQASKAVSKKEGATLRKAMKADIRKAAPGGKPYAQSTKSVISRTRALRLGKRAGSQKALSALAKYVRMQYKSDDGNSYIAIGFVGGGRGAASPLSIIKMQQEGYYINVSDKTRKYFAVTAHYFLPQKSRLKRFFHIKKSTTRFHVPGRPIIDPFWTTNRDKSSKRMFVNFHKKMAGMKI